MEKTRKIISVLLVLGLIFTVMGGTLAYWNWQTTEEQKTLVSFTVSNNFSCSADGGGNITSSDVRIIPTEVNDSTVGNYIKREVKVYPKTLVSGVSIYMNLWLNVNSIDTGLSNSNNFRYAFTTGSTSPTDGVVSSGNFREATTGSQIQLLGDKVYTATTAETYYLWIWLGAEETSATTMNQSFSLSLGGICSESKSYETILLNDNVTVDLPNRLIPITLDNDGTVKTASKDSTWANYSNREWANAVLVKEIGNNTREYYRNNIGVEVSKDDILAYYVYVPRYKYKIWTTSTSSSGSEQEIEIVFENKDTAKSTGTQVGEYITHPAFTFDNNELNGIWVGKFETTGSPTAPTIKPNVQSLRSQTVSAQFKTAKIFETSTYGLTTNIDAHMMMNSEWGAAAYLSHSKYGRCIDGVCEEIRRNNNSSYYTGYSEVNVATTGYSETSSSTNEFGTSSSITQPYNTEVGYKASTTGNITGIYDMSGGAWDRVMGVLADSNGNPRSGNDTTTNSGYNGMLGNGTMYTTGVDFPDSKYYNLYTSTNSSSSSSSLSLTACNGGVCYGHGLSEVSNWYSDYAYFVYASNPWVGRGGRFYDGISAGAFYFLSYSGGVAGSDVAARSVLVAGA